jgi:hypothetical protein
MPMCVRFGKVVSAGVRPASLRLALAGRARVGEPRQPRRDSNTGRRVESQCPSAGWSSLGLKATKGPFGPVAHWLLADRGMAIVRDAIVAAGVAVVSIGIWDLIFWASSLQFPVE